MAFDVFVGPVRCPNCGSDRVAEIATHIRDGDADSSMLGIGFELDAIDLETDSLLDDGYALVREPEPDEPLRLLERWTCWSCETDQWAIVEIADRTVRSIEAVTFSRRTLESVHFISEINAIVLADRLRGSQLEAGEDPVAELRRRLPDSEDADSAGEVD